MEKRIRAGILFAQSISVKLKVGDPGEGSPPSIIFFFKEDFKLIAAYSIAGHESWAKEFYYFFNEGRIIKYLEVINRIDNPPRKAIIYDKMGNILWKNTDTAGVSHQKITTMFESILSSLKSFNKY